MNKVQKDWVLNTFNNNSGSKENKTKAYGNTEEVTTEDSQAKPQYENESKDNNDDNNESKVQENAK